MFFMFKFCSQMFKFFKDFVYALLCIFSQAHSCTCVNLMYDICTETYGVPKRALDPMELEVEGL